MNNTIEAEYEKGAIPYYVKRMTGEMDETLFLPMSFIETGEKEKVIYDISNMRALKSLNKLEAGEFYSYLEQIIRLIHRAEEYLIGLEGYELSTDTIFINENGLVRIKYSPNAENSCKLDKLLVQILDMPISTNLAGYIENTRALLKENPSSNKLLSHIETIRREIRISGIK